MIEKENLSERVYVTIKNMIQDGALKPGKKIHRKELETVLGVSRTPINEALNRLSGQRLVEQRNRDGYFVREYTCKEVVDLFAARGAVEGMATRLAVEQATDAEIEQITCTFDGITFPLDGERYQQYEKADREFHSLLIYYSKNDMIRQMNEEFGYIVKAATQRLVRPPEETIHEHREIIAAIRRRDAKRAGDLMTEHHMRSRNILVQNCRDY